MFVPTNFNDDLTFVKTVKNLLYQDFTRLGTYSVFGLKVGTFDNPNCPNTTYIYLPS